jgi:hypothetical protein
MKRKYTTIKDSFKTKIYEDDIIEFFDHTYAHEGVYIENGEYLDIVDNLSNGFIDRAIEHGYFVKYEWTMLNGTKCLLMYKPCVGVVKWSKKFVTYEPTISCPDDYHDDCFKVVVRNGKKDGAYCKVIGNIIDNPELIKN